MLVVSDLNIFPSLLFANLPTQLKGKARLKLLITAVGEAVVTKDENVLT